MSFLSYVRGFLIGSGKLFYNYERGNGESSKFKEFKYQEFDQFFRSYFEEGRVVED